MLLHYSGLPSFLKLDAIYFGPYKILQVITPVTVKLELGSQDKFSPVVNGQYLRPYKGKAAQPVVQPIAGDDPSLFTVEKILKMRINEKRLIKWHGFSSLDNLWSRTRTLPQPT